MYTETGFFYLRANVLLNEDKNIAEIQSGAIPID